MRLLLLVIVALVDDFVAMLLYCGYIVVALVTCIQ